MANLVQPTQWAHVEPAPALCTSAQIAQAMQFLSLPEDRRDPDCRLLYHVKTILGTAHCEALSRFKHSETHSRFNQALEDPSI